MLGQLTLIIMFRFAITLMAPPPGGSGGGGGLLSALLVLAALAGIVYFLIRKMNTNRGTPAEFATFQGSTDSLFSQPFHLIGSLVVVISFFLHGDLLESPSASTRESVAFRSFASYSLCLTTAF